VGCLSVDFRSIGSSDGRQNRAFHPIHGGFQKTTAMVADVILPSPTSAMADGSYRHVSRQRTAARIAVFSHPPFAFAENLQAGAVDRHVDRFDVFPNVQRHAYLCGPLGQRRGIGNIESNLHQCGERSSELFGLAIGESKQLSQFQQAFNRAVAVHEGVSDLRLSIGVMPVLDHVLAKPERNRASLNERLVILAPIFDPVRAFTCSGRVETPFRRGIGSLSPCPTY
jgi:hypothetical protein